MKQANTAGHYRGASLTNLVHAYQRTLPPRFPQRIRTKPFFKDEVYNQLPYPDALFYMRALDQRTAEAFGTQLLNSREERKLEVRAFLARHSIEINPSKNEYSQFDAFFAANVDFSEDRDDEYHMVSHFWMSVLIDLSLLVGDALIEQYPFLSWKFQTKRVNSSGYKHLSIHGIGYEPPKMKKILWGDPLSEIVENYGGRFVFATPGAKQPEVIPLAGIIEGNFLKWIRAREVFENASHA